MAVPERPKKRKRPLDEDDEDAQEEAEEQDDEDVVDTTEAEEDEVPNASRPSSQRANGSSSQSANGPSSRNARDPELDYPYDLVDDLYPSFRLPRAYEGNNDDLMSEDTDEEALERVLDDEEELDAQDLVAEGEYEDKLWTNLAGDPS